MLVTAVGIDTAPNELHPVKAFHPMLVTELGIDTAVTNHAMGGYLPNPSLARMILQRW
jgi:hypothetical protein